MGADNPGWVAPQAGAARARSAALTLMDRARARKHDTDLGDRLTGQGFGLPGRDAVLTITGLQNAGTLPDCSASAREQVIDLARAGDAGIGTVVLLCDHRYDFGDRGRGACIRGARGRLMAWPAAGYGPLATGGLRGAEDEQA